MKKRIDIEQLTQKVTNSLELLRQNKGDTTRKVIKLSSTLYLYRGLRFEFTKTCLEIRYIKHDKEEYFKCYEFGRSRAVKSYYYKTSLLLHGQIDSLYKLCVDEFQNRG